MVIYQADEKNKVFLVAVVNESRYRDTQKTPLVTYETLIIFSFFGSASRKQHHKYHLYVRPSHLVSHEICFIQP